MKKSFTIIVFMLLFSTIAFGQADEEYRITLKKMFEVSGSEGSYQIIINQMFTMYKQKYSDVETEVWNDIEEEFHKTSLDDITEMLVPVYSKYLTKEDLEELITFYQTEVGERLAKNTPSIMQEAMQVGQLWGMKIDKDFKKMMKEKRN